MNTYTLDNHSLICLNIAETLSGFPIGMVNSALLVVDHDVLVLIRRRTVTGAIRMRIAQLAGRCRRTQSKTLIHNGASAGGEGCIHQIRMRMHRTWHRPGQSGSRRTGHTVQR